MSEKNFGQLGASFQEALLKTIIEEKKFATTIIDVIDSKYFDTPYFRYLMQSIKEFYVKHKTIPTYTSLKEKVLSENSKDTTVQIHLDTLTRIQELEVRDVSWIKTTASNFCKQQVLKKVFNGALKAINTGTFDECPDIEREVIDAYQIGATTEEITDIFNNPEAVLELDARVPIPTGIDGLDSLLKGGLAKGEFGVVIAPLGTGKSLGISEPVLTPYGWKRMGDIKLGNEVMGSDGNAQYVIGVYPQGIRPIYKINFTDGTDVRCDEEHLWFVNTLNMRQSKTRLKNKIIRTPNYGFKVMKTSEMMKDIKKRGTYNYRLPIIDPVEFNSVDVRIDPYLLGILLGDGCLTEKSGISISTKDEEIFTNINMLQKHSSFTEYERVTLTGVKFCNRIRLKSTIKEDLVKYDLLNCKSNNKFIPKDYLYNTKDVRINVLQGLMDTDGSVDKRGCCEFSTVSEQLAKDVREIVLSLGGSVRMTTRIPSFTYNGIKKKGQLLYRLNISFSNNIIPFKLRRKKEKFKTRKKYIYQKFVKSIEYSHDEEAVCIKVSNSDELFVTNDYVLTHNTTLATLFANSAFNTGHHVLQMFFEDNQNTIKRKHFTKWTGITPDDLGLPENKENVLRIVREKMAASSGSLNLAKYPSGSTTVSQIKSKLRRLHAEGTVIDLLIVDYVECLAPERMGSEDEWKGEGSIMRQLDAMTSEFNIAIWVTTQGSRESISSEIVTSDQIGGSIKKAQIGHVVISVAKTLEQKEHKLATMALLKSRIGKDGVIFTNCIFDNEYLIINTESQNTLLGFKEEKAVARAKRPAELYITKVDNKNGEI
jgi:replicative DNA helicase